MARKPKTAPMELKLEKPKRSQTKKAIDFGAEVADTPPAAAKAETPVAKPVEKTPVAKSSASKATAGKASSTKAPAAKTPVAKTPVAKTPVAKTPAANTATPKATKAPVEKPVVAQVEAPAVAAETKAAAKPADKPAEVAVVAPADQVRAPAASTAVASKPAAPSKTASAWKLSVGPVAAMSALGRENMNACAKSSASAVKGIDDLRAEFMSFTRQCMENNLSATRALAQARTMREVLDLQAQFSRQGFDSFLSESSKLAGLSFNMVKEASAPIQAQAGVTVEKIFKSRAA